MSTINERLKALRTCMEAQGIDCYLVFTSDDHQSEYLDAHFKTREFLSGFTGSAGWMAVTKDRAILWADGRYHVQAARQIAGTQIELYKSGLPETQTLEGFLEDEIKEGMVAACDGRTISASYYKKLSEVISPGAFRTDIDLFEQIWEDRPACASDPVYELPLEISGRSRSDKIAHIRKTLKESGADAYVLADLSSIMWLFNLRGSDVNCNPVAFSYAYITMQEAMIFLQMSSMDEELLQSLREDRVAVLPYEETVNFLTNIRGLVIASDPDEVNSALYALLAQNNTLTDVTASDITPKQIKNETEIRLARKYHELDAVAMIRFIRYIKDAVTKGPVTECEAAVYIDGLRAQNEGYKDLSFETICAYGENGAIIHYAPEPESCATLAPKGFLLLDSGAQYLGATTDITRTIVLGELSDIERRDFTAVLKSMIALADAVFLDGTSGTNLDILARGPIWRLGIDYRHGTGHGIGAFLNVHEGPQNFRYKVSRDVEPVSIV
ncbi:MAG: aminopeptidase P family N-terminal domain-containing protein, partial [Lachnospiraceae bacterium]|nr:aminopeptidase P family N-terminal domain-containing protein [Lachnospiraceae bacterium]